MHNKHVPRCTDCGCRYYGLLAQRFCLLKREYQACFEECFRRQYALIHRLETNKLRNVARFFGHLLATDAISWEVIDSVRLTEDDTTSSSRIFIKVLFQVRAELVDRSGDTITVIFHPNSVHWCPLHTLPLFSACQR